VDFKVDHGAYDPAFAQSEFFRLGHLIETTSAASTQPASIRPNRLTQVELRTENPGFFEKMVAEVNIKFSTPELLKYWITSPSGKIIPLHDNGQIFEKSGETFLDEHVQGTWILNIESSSPMRVAKLLEWSLTFANTTCE
jgi:hypothetical protein